MTTPPPDVEANDELSGDDLELDLIARIANMNTSFESNGATIDLNTKPTVEANESVEKVVDAFWQKFDNGRIEKMPEMMEWIRQSVTTYRTQLIKDDIARMEAMKKKHWVFECSGPRPNKTTKFENFCDDTECRSIDNQKVIAHNQALDTLISYKKQQLTK